MKIKIRKDVKDLYLLDNTGNIDNNWEFIFNKLAGKVVEVDTTFLFKYEYNIKPIKGLTKEPIRIFDNYVEKIIDDERIDKAYCNLCECFSKSFIICDKCGKHDYLEIIEEEEEEFGSSLLDYFNF